MNFDLLALKAKKSVSHFLSRKDGPENVSPVIIHNQIEKGTNDLKKPSSSPSTASEGPNTHESSSSNESPSKRKSVMGSMRRNKLRSINSLRSLRSPTKAKQPDTVAAPCDNFPQTPKRQPKSALSLGFQASPTDEPIFDLSRRDSTLDRSVHHSSPVPIPSSENQNYQPFTTSSIIPAGTVPSSPAPIQKILDMDQSDNSLSPTLEPANKLEPPRMRLPTPPQNIQQLNQTKDAQLETPNSNSEPDAFRFPSRPAEEENTLLDAVQAAMEHYYSLTPDSEDEQPSVKHRAGPVKERQDIQQSTVDELTEQFNGQCLTADNNKTFTLENALVIIGKNYLVKVFHRGDFQRRIEVTAYEGHEDGPDDGPEHILARREEDFAAAEDIMSKLSNFILHNKAMLDNGGKEMMLDEALAEGLVPKWLDLDLDMVSTKKLQSRIYKPAKTQKRESVWGQHAGLYDGTGYGAASSSRSSVATDTMMNVAYYHSGEESSSSEEGVDKTLPGYQNPSSFGSMPDSLRRLVCMDTNKIGVDDKDPVFALHA